MDPVETETTEPVATEAPAVEATPEPAAVEAPPEWDGDINSLVSQPWVPESARAHLSRHLEEVESARTRADFLTRMFDADDANAEVSKELESLRKSLGDLTQERDGLRGELDTYRQQVMEIEEDREYDRLKAAYPDIFDDCRTDEKNPDAYTGAWPMLLDLMVRGYDEDTAARLARSLLPAAPAAPAAPQAQSERRQVQVPPSVAAASRGGSNPSSTVNAAEANENFEQRTRRLMDEARARGE